MTDRVHANLYNTQKLYNLEVPFIQGIRVIEDIIKEKFEKYEASFRNIAFTDSEPGVSAQSFEDQWSANADQEEISVKGHVHLYFNLTQASIEQMALLNAVDKMIGPNAWITKEVPRKTRNLFDALKLPVPTRLLRD